ncbi:hypothetical protein Taro_051019 [Colocasia esculenta]|uniref:ACT domain-containing protein ACR n=1 Tax=Colocasia esculenta TaxID=4460 RepID=A0A843XEW5_COLES|nr:hypothetical protein [Colocasia esculenta]
MSHTQCGTRTGVPPKGGQRLTPSAALFSLTHIRGLEEIPFSCTRPEGSPSRRTRLEGVLSSCTRLEGVPPFCAYKRQAGEDNRARIRFDPARVYHRRRHPATTSASIWLEDELVSKIVRIGIGSADSDRFWADRSDPGLLYIETADRPGLLLEIIKILADINVEVESAEIDTEGLVAKDKFHVSYRGAALNNSLSQVLTNCLRYTLRKPETDEDSY